LLTDDWELPVGLTIDHEGAAEGQFPPTALSCAEYHAERWVDMFGRDYGCYFEKDGAFHVRIYGVGSFIFTRQSMHVRGVPEGGLAPDAFTAAFHREVVPFVLQRHSWEVLHASGLVIAGECVALCGNSEMGKSTLAHAWRRRGGSVYADDAIPFRVERGSISIQTFPFQIRLRPSSLRYFEAQNGKMSQPEPDRLPAAMMESTVGLPPTSDARHLRAIYLLDRRHEAEGPVQLEAVSPQTALPALLHQAYCLTLQDQKRNRQMVAHYIALVNAVPIFRLSYPTGLGYVEAILDELTAHGMQRATGQCPGRDSG
jgi:hypothetical protein